MNGVVKYRVDDWVKGYDTNQKVVLDGIIVAIDDDVVSIEWLLQGDEFFIHEDEKPSKVGGN